jgi:phage-related protein
MAQFRDFSYSYTHISRLAKWSASFVAHFPFWLSETLHSDSRVPASGVGYTLANAGNAPTRCKVTVTAPGGGIADNCQIENTTVGTTTKYRGTLTQYEDLEIDNRVDSDDFEVLNDAVDDMANFEGDFIILNPGNNTVEYTGTANAIVKFEWRDCWY